MDQVKTAVISNIVQLASLDGKNNKWDKYQFIMNNGDMPFRYLVSGTPQPYKAGDNIKYKLSTTQGGELKMSPYREDYKKKSYGGSSGTASASPKQSSLHAAVNLIGNIFKAKGSNSNANNMSNDVPDAIHISEMGDIARLVIRTASFFEKYIEAETKSQVQRQTPAPQQQTPQQILQQQQVVQQQEVQQPLAQQPAPQQQVQQNDATAGMQPQTAESLVNNVPF